MKNTFKKGDRVIFDGRKAIVSAINGDTVICRNILDNGKTGKMRHLASISQLKLDKQDKAKPRKYSFFLQQGRFNGLLQVWDITDGKEMQLTDTQEQKMKLEIETALKERDALNAVAEAAKELSKAYAISNGSAAAIRFVRAKRELLDLSLEALAAIREGKVQK